MNQAQTIHPFIALVECCLKINGTIKAALSTILLSLPLQLHLTADHFSTCLVPPNGNREVCFAVSCEAGRDDTPQSKYQHVLTSSIQLNRVKCSGLSNTAAKLVYASNWKCLLT